MRSPIRGGMPVWSRTMASSTPPCGASRAHDGLLRRAGRKVTGSGRAPPVSGWGGLRPVRHRRGFHRYRPGGAQPMQIDGGRYTLTSWAKSTTTGAARRARPAGRAFETHSDSEVILRLISATARRCCRDCAACSPPRSGTRRAHLFAARDPSASSRLLCRRRRGVPLRRPVKALLATGASTPRRAGGRGRFLMWGSVPETFTLYTHIHALPVAIRDLAAGGPAASNATFRRGRAVRRRARGTGRAARAVAPFAPP